MKDQFTLLIGVRLRMWCYDGVLQNNILKEVMIGPKVNNDLL